MGNLVRGPKRVLITSLLSDTLVMSNGKLYIKDVGQVLKSAIVDCAKQCYAAGTLAQFLVQVAPKYPCDACYSYEGGIYVADKERLVNDPMKIGNINKPLVAKLETLQSTSNVYLNSADIEKAIGQVVEMSDPATTKMSAKLKQRMTYTYTAGTITITVYDMNGVLQATYTGANVAAVVAAIAADADAKIEVYASAVGSITIQSADYGFGFYTEVTNLTKSATSNWIYIIAKDVYTIPKIQSTPNFGVVTELVVGEYPKLDWIDVARQFPVKWEDVGRVLPGVTENTEYCRYYFQVRSKAYDLVGAGHLNDYDAMYEIYIPKALAESAYWDDILIANDFDLICSGLDDGSVSASTS